MQLLKRLWHDEVGFVATTDLLLIGAILVLGTIVGLVTVRDQVVQEFADLGMAIGSLDQSYRYQGTNTSTDPCYVAGSSYDDEPDFCEEANGADAVSVQGLPLDEGTALTIP